MANERSRAEVLKARVARERAAAGARRVRFSKELRAEAIELALSSGRARDQFAAEMGIGKTSLQRWVAKGRRAGRASRFQQVQIETSPPPKSADAIAVVLPSGARIVGLTWQQLCRLLGVPA